MSSTEAPRELFQVRSRRPRPHLDDKILTDWNGLMISSLAKGGRILNEPRYTVAAKTAADFIIRKLKTKDGRLLHRFRDNTAGIQGFLDDYAFFINSLLDLYETIFALSYLKEKKVFLDPSMKILYYPRGSFRSLFRQYFRYGRGRAYTAWKHRKLTSWRQAGPVALVFYLFSSACLGVVNPFYWLLLLPYPLLVSTVAIVRPGWKKAPRGTDDERTASRALRPLLAYAFMTMHVSWGVGFIWASFRHILSPRGMRA